jgi:hypothetical protein
MKTLREMMDLIESAQLLANEGWEFRWGKPSPINVAAKEKINRVGKERIQQLLHSSGLNTDDIDLFIAQLFIYLKNNQIDVKHATLGVLGLAPFVEASKLPAYTDKDRVKQITKHRIENFVNQINQELQKNASTKVDETSPDALAKIDDLTRK